MFFEFWSFEGDSFCRDQGHTAPDPVGLDPLKISVARYLSFFCGLAFYADGAVLHHRSDLVIRRNVLKARNLPIEPDLFDVPFDLFRSRLVGRNPDFAPDVICHENAQGLGGSACAPDGACIIDLQIIGAVVVLSKSDAGDSLDWRCHHAFCKQSNRGSDGAVDGIDLFGKVSDSALGKIDTYRECRLFSALSFSF